MDQQLIFDKVKTHLLTQNRISEDTNGVCMYRGPDGLMCAVGCLIDDAHYMPSFEGMTVNQLMRNDLLTTDPFNDENFDLLGALQRVHDGFDPKDWVFRLNEVAERYGLNS